MDSTVKLNNVKYEEEVIIIDSDDDIPKPIIGKSQKKIRRKVLLDKLDNNRETLIITQKVKVNVQKVKYIINLNNNVPEISKEDKTCEGKNIILERYVPKCARPKCQSSFYKSGKYHRKVSKLQSKQRRTGHREKPKKEWKHHKFHHVRSTTPKELGTNSKKPVVDQCELDDTLSSLSLSPMQSCEISYDDVSSDSFTCSETDIETLIKRSKERDKLVSKSRFGSHPMRKDN